MDDGILERHGVSCGSGFVNVREEPGSRITVSVYDGDGSRQRAVDPASARYLAEKLWRLASRIDARKRPNTPAQQIASAGGKARAANLSSSRKSEIARRAANARWGKGKS